MNRKPDWSEAIIFLLVLLLVYTADSKLLDFTHFRAAMLNQELPRWLAHVLIFSLPEAELVAAFLLIFPRTRLAGLVCTLVLMPCFSGYVGLVVLHFYDRVPRSCGGWIKAMGWRTHFAFNLFFLLLTIIGIYRERRARQEISNTCLKKKIQNSCE